MSKFMTTVNDHPLPPASPDMVMATPEMFDPMRFDSFTPLKGFDPLNFRDLTHIDKLTGGKVAVNVQRANPGAGRWTGSPWHVHHLDFQFVYLINGSALFEFEGAGLLELKKGAAIYQPPMNRHREFAISDDMEVLMISMPAVFDTTFWNWDEEREEYTTVRVGTVDDAGMAMQNIDYT